VADGVDGVLDPGTSPLVSSTPLATSAPLPSLDPSTVTSLTAADGLRLAARRRDLLSPDWQACGADGAPLPRQP